MGSPHRYLPNTPEQVAGMLAAAGRSSIDELFADIPADVRLSRPLALPRAMSEPELIAELTQMSSSCASANSYTCYLGGGIYDHYVPSVIQHLLLRGEFYTAYTPYQAEVSQGTLQAIFEYQTMITELTAMEVANASMYEAGSAMAEAAIMACTATKRNTVLVARTVNPAYRKVLSTYAHGRGIELREVGFCPRGGRSKASRLTKDEVRDAACLIVQSPNYFGIVEDMPAIADVIHKAGGLLVSVVNPISLGLLAPPGDYGADIAIGEGQSMGIPMSFGGPLLGFFATTSKLMRKMPGRLVGQTVDAQGRRGFVLTLQAREQHIRRENATSNICSNQALCALAATIYLSLMGPNGLKEVAQLATYRAHYLRDRIAAIPGFSVPFFGPFFNEFAVDSQCSPHEINEDLLERGIIGGKPMSNDYPELAGHSLWAVTEMRTRDDLDTLVRELEVLA